MEIPISSAVGRDEKRKVHCARTTGSRKLSSALCLAAVQSGPLLLKSDCRAVSAPMEPTAPLVWAWVTVARAAALQMCGVGTQCRPQALPPASGSRLQGVRLSKVQDGNSAKPPSCKIRGSWWSGGCSVGEAPGSLLLARPSGLFEAGGCKTAA